MDKFVEVKLVFDVVKGEDDILVVISDVVDGIDVNIDVNSEEYG